MPTWTWILIVVLFLYLMGRRTAENLSTTRSPLMGYIGTALDAVALVAITCGIFGALMAIFLGIFAPRGAHLAGANLRDMVIWTVVLLVIGIGLGFASMVLRRLGGEGAPVVRPMRGGH